MVDQTSTHNGIRLVPEQGGTSHQPDDEELLHFALAGTLPQGHALAVHRRLRILAHLVYEEGAPRVQNMQHLGEVELSLLLPLVKRYPDYCPYEVLLAHYASASVTDQTIARAREQLDEAWEEGLGESVMKPIRTILSWMRPKLHDLGIRIVSRRKMGYQLMSAAR